MCLFISPHLVGNPLSNRETVASSHSILAVIRGVGDVILLLHLRCYAFCWCFISFALNACRHPFAKKAEPAGYTQGCLHLVWRELCLLVTHRNAVISIERAVFVGYIQGPSDLQWKEQSLWVTYKDPEIFSGKSRACCLHARVLGCYMDRTVPVCFTGCCWKQCLFVILVTNTDAEILHWESSVCWLSKKQAGILYGEIRFTKYNNDKDELPWQYKNHLE